MGRKPGMVLTILQCTGQPPLVRWDLKYVAHTQVTNDLSDGKSPCLVILEKVEENEKILCKNDHCPSNNIWGCHVEINSNLK